MSHKKSFDIEGVKQAAAGRAVELLTTLGGIPADVLDGKHHPCPKCAGTDRFRLVDAAAGAVLCNQCFSQRNGDFLAALQWARGWTLPETLGQVAEHLGVKPTKSKKQTKALALYPDESAVKLALVKQYASKSLPDQVPEVVREDAYDTFVVLRVNLPTEPGHKQKKTYRPVYRGRLPDGQEGFILGYPGGPRPLFRRRELAEAPKGLVVVCGGEKSVEAAVGLGLVATTCAGGEKSVKKTDWSPLVEFGEVVVSIDNDAAGAKYGELVTAALKVLKPELQVKILELPGLPKAGDVVEWVQAGGTLEEFLRLAEEAEPLSPEDIYQLADNRSSGAADAEPPKHVPFPTEVLPPVVHEYVKRGAKALGCDEAYIALPLLVALASAVGNARRIRLKSTWCEPCVLWAVVVAESGTLKSPAYELATRPLFRLQEKALADHEKATDLHQRDKIIHDADAATWKRSRSRGSDEPPPREPEEPVAVRYLCEDTTVEALAVLLEQQPRGLLMARDELSGWVNSFDAYKSCRGTDVAHYLSMHRAGSLTVDRKTGRRVIYVPRAAVNVTGTVQPKVLAASLVGRYQPGGSEEAMDKPAREHFDNGLAARLLFAMPPKKAKRWTDADLPEAVESAMGQLFDRLLGLEPDHDEEDRLVPVDLQLSPQGKEAWVCFYNGHAQEEAKMTGHLASAWSKLEGYAARFALLVHLIRQAANDRTLACPNQIDELSVAAGVALARWFGDEASRVYAEIGADTETPEARELRELKRIIRDHGGEITPRDLMRASRRYRANAAVAEAALMGLVSEGEAEYEATIPSRHGGRPTLVFRLIEPDAGDTTCEKPKENEVLSPSPGSVEEELQAEDTETSIAEGSPEEELEWTA